MAAKSLTPRHRLSKSMMTLILPLSVAVAAASLSMLYTCVAGSSSDGGGSSAIKEDVYTKRGKRKETTVATRNQPCIVTPSHTWVAQHK